jgi:hypothetical protein
MQHGQEQEEEQQEQQGQQQEEEQQDFSDSDEDESDASSSQAEEAAAQAAQAAPAPLQQHAPAAAQPPPQQEEEDLKWVDWQADGQLCFKRGKHAGKALSAVPRGYVQWMAHTCPHVLAGDRQVLLQWLEYHVPVPDHFYEEVLVY